MRLFEKERSLRAIHNGTEGYAAFCRHRFFVNGVHYYAPLTSPKPKHRNMKNQIDFLKIEGGEWGAINFNDMIPVHPKSLIKVEMKILPTDSEPDRAYKNLLSNQLSRCNSHRETKKRQSPKLRANFD